MAIVKWEPFGDMDRFFEDFGRLSASRMNWDLAVDLFEEKGDLVAEMNLPGIDPEKVDISVEDNYLRITGSRSEEKENKDKHYYNKEIRRGSFQRIVALPEAVQTSKVKATYEGGVLQVVMPKEMPSKSDAVKVEVKKKGN